MARLDPTTLEQIEKFRAHSVLLNTVSWQLHDALGLIPPGAERYDGDVLAVLPRICEMIRVAVAPTRPMETEQFAALCRFIDALTDWHSGRWTFARDIDDDGEYLWRIELHSPTRSHPVVGGGRAGAHHPVRCDVVIIQSTEPVPPLLTAVDILVAEVPAEELTEMAEDAGLMPGYDPEGGR